MTEPSGIGAYFGEPKAPFLMVRPVRDARFSVTRLQCRLNGELSRIVSLPADDAYFLQLLGRLWDPRGISDDEVDRPQVGAAGDPPGGEPAQLEPRGAAPPGPGVCPTCRVGGRPSTVSKGHHRLLLEQVVEAVGAGAGTSQRPGRLREHSERFAGGDRGEDEQGTHGRARIRRRGQRGSGECRDPGDDEHRCGREGPAAGLPTRGGPQLLVRGAQPAGCGAGAADGAI